MKTLTRTYIDKENAISDKNDLKAFGIKAKVKKKVRQVKQVYWEVKWRQ